MRAISYALYQQYRRNIFFFLLALIPLLYFLMPMFQDSGMFFVQLFVLISLVIPLNDKKYFIPLYHATAALPISRRTLLQVIFYFSYIVNLTLIVLAILLAFVIGYFTQPFSLTTTDIWLVLFFLSFIILTPGMSVLTIVYNFDALFITVIAITMLVILGTLHLVLYQLLSAFIFSLIVPIITIGLSFYLKHYAINHFVKSDALTYS